MDKRTDFSNIIEKKTKQNKALKKIYVNKQQLDYE